MKPNIDNSSLEDSSIENWAKEFWEVYEENNSNIKNLALAWLMIVEDASSVGEHIREKNYVKALQDLTHAFCWTLSFLNILQYSTRIPKQFKLVNMNIDGYKIDNLSDIIWYKYPNCCPVCHSRACICPILPSNAIENLKKEKKEDFAKKRHEKGQRPKSVKAWENMFGGIYSKSHELSTLKDVCFHYLEEVGEVAKAIRYLHDAEKPKDIILYQTELIEEIADVLSWTFSLVRQIDSLLIFCTELGVFLNNYSSNNGKLQFHQILWREYGDQKTGKIKCPICNKRPCRCIQLKFLSENSRSASFPEK
ncbi:MAG: hypothetical protein ACFFD4_40400 [Candidatus Odinarchaeota archaeon]